MNPLEAVGYGIGLALALVGLLRWKRRYDTMVRLSRCLHAYLAGKKGDENPFEEAEA